MKLNYTIRNKHLCPRIATANSAGIDLQADIKTPFEIRSGYMVAITTGVCVEIPEGYAGLLFIRSSLGKQGLMLSNGVGVIDSDYRGEIIASITNTNNEYNPAVVIRPGDRIVQLVIVPIPFIQLERVSALSETSRGTGGFGSTGK